MNWLAFVGGAALAYFLFRRDVRENSRHDLGIPRRRPEFRDIPGIVNAWDCEVGDLAEDGIGRRMLVVDVTEDDLIVEGYKGERQKWDRMIVERCLRPDRRCKPPWPTVR